MIDVIWNLYKKNKLAKIWLTYALKHLDSVTIRAAMTCIINDWIDILNSYVDKEPCTSASKLYHQGFKLS